MGIIKNLILKIFIKQLLSLFRTRIFTDNITIVFYRLWRKWSKSKICILKSKYKLPIPHTRNHTYLLDEGRNPSHCMGISYTCAAYHRVSYTLQGHFHHKRVWGIVSMPGSRGHTFYIRPFSFLLIRQLHFY